MGCSNSKAKEGAIMQKEPIKIDFNTDQLQSIESELNANRDQSVVNLNRNATQQM